MTHFLNLIPESLLQPTSGSDQVGVSSRGADRLMQTFLPFLDLPALLGTPRRSSNASEALSLACMAVGAIHLKSLYQRSIGAACLGASEDANARHYDKLASDLIESSIALGQSSLLSDDSSSRPPHDLKAPLDGSSPLTQYEDKSQMLATCSTLMLARSLAGVGGYEATLGLASDFVRLAGGPAALLAAEATGDSLLFTGATKRTSTAKRLRIARALLEDLAAYDVCLGLTTGRLSDGVGGEDLSSWLFRYAPSPGLRTASPGVDEDWDTVRLVNVIFCNGRSRADKATEQPHSAALHLFCQPTSVRTLVEGQSPKSPEDTNMSTD